MAAPAPTLKNNQRLSKAAGGARQGAGRKPGVPNKATAELKALAQKYTDKALRGLVQVLETGESEAARVSAANAILDRGWGKPSQSVEHAAPGGGPIKHIFDLSDDALTAIALRK